MVDFAKAETRRPPRERTVTVIGCDGRHVSTDAAKALGLARTVIGAGRLKAHPPGAERIELRHLDEALNTLIRSPGPAVVLASSNTSFSGVVRAVRARGIVPAVIPAILVHHGITTSA